MLDGFSPSLLLLDDCNSLILSSVFLPDFGEKAGRANNELLGFTLQYHRGFSGSQRRSVPKDVRFTSPCDLLPEIEPIESEMIFLGLDLFHRNSVSYHILEETLNHDETAPRGSILDASTELTP
jgi:hypothetical protein